MSKFIFVTGGVVSSLGKGITAAALGRLLIERGYTVSINKLDPYLNTSPGLMDPIQHGEVFVTDDGAETDLDLGHYERFIDQPLTKNHSNSAGQVYKQVLLNEVSGVYSGGTVQVIPNVTNEIKKRVLDLAKNIAPDILITEIGGTVGDIESQPFIEAIRQIQWDVGEENCCFIHVTLIPYLKAAGELKSKPTQHSVKELLGLGIQPDVLVCRADMQIGLRLKKKIAGFCNINIDNVIENLNAESLYEVPLLLEKEGLCTAVLKDLGMSENKPDLTAWFKIVKNIINPENKVKICVLGSYTSLQDSYISLTEALIHAGGALSTKIEIDWMNTEDFSDFSDLEERISACSGVIIPDSGNVLSVIPAIDFCARNDIICLTLGSGINPFAKHILEFGRDFAELEFEERTEIGSRAIDLPQNSTLTKIYGEKTIAERFRKYSVIARASIEKMSKKQDIECLLTSDEMIAAVIDNSKRWFVGLAYHPEFKSRPNRPHPVFLSFVSRACEDTSQN